MIRYSFQTWELLNAELLNCHLEPVQRFISIQQLPQSAHCQVLCRKKVKKPSRWVDGWGRITVCQWGKEVSSLIFLAVSWKQESHLCFVKSSRSFKSKTDAAAKGSIFSPCFNYLKISWFQLFAHTSPVANGNNRQQPAFGNSSWPRRHILPRSNVCSCHLLLEGTQVAVLELRPAFPLFTGRWDGAEMARLWCAYHWKAKRCIKILSISHSSHKCLWKIIKCRSTHNLINILYWSYVTEISRKTSKQVSIGTGKQRSKTTHHKCCW